MSTDQTPDNNTPHTENDIGQAIAPAIISALLICVVRFFTIPWSIWKGAALRLADMRRKKQETEDNAMRSEFPVLDWFRASWDGLIFLSWFFGVLASVLGMAFMAFTLAGNPYGPGAGSAIWVLISGLIYTYFSVIAMSLAKEGLILILSIALNVEKLANARTSR
ncbi:hypothetical protein [Vreelandella jeotgali]|uniref:hypothetical protein n=1 Tax=Vreelandella jeotgali TaxID=553386 RepID=UPI000349EDF1|nr:hypothetical protein [Halomonas jeotgali]